MDLTAIRYFLAIVETMNFTRAAANCGIRQPTLTRAIKKLEEQLGDELFNRERNHTHLTELGRMILPHLKKCHDSVAQAKDLALQNHPNPYQILRLAISDTIPMHLISGSLAALKRQHPDLVIEYVRGTADDMIVAIDTGRAELAVAGPLGMKRQSMDHWSLFDEDFALAVSNSGRWVDLESVGSVEMKQLHDMAILIRPYCECHADLANLFEHADIAIDKAPVVSRDDDLIPLVRSDLGVCVIPRSLGTGYGFAMIPIRDCDLSRTVSLYSSAGRNRTAAGIALAGLLTSHDWGSIPERNSGGEQTDGRLTVERISDRWRVA